VAARDDLVGVTDDFCHVKVLKIRDDKFRLLLPYLSGWLANAFKSCTGNRQLQKFTYCDIPVITAPLHRKNS
jgi:hypothetical protein